MNNLLTEITKIKEYYSKASMHTANVPLSFTFQKLSKQKTQHLEMLSKLDDHEVRVDLMHYFKESLLDIINSIKSIANKSDKKLVSIAESQERGHL